MLSSLLTLSENWTIRFSKLFICRCVFLNLDSIFSFPKRGDSCMGVPVLLLSEYVKFLGESLNTEVEIRDLSSIMSSCGEL